MNCERCSKVLDMGERLTGKGKLCRICADADAAPIDWDAVLARVEASMRAWRVFGEAEREAEQCCTSSV